MPANSAATFLPLALHFCRKTANKHSKVIHMSNNNEETVVTPTTELSPPDLSRRKTLNTLGMASLLGATGVISGLASSGAFAQRGRPRSSAAAVSSRATSSAASSVATSASTSSAASGSCVLIPTETIGPFPLSTLLDNSLVLRENIAEDRTGIPLQVKIKLVNVNNGCTPISGYVYIWHCDKDGNYSGYGQESGKTYCRGIQYADTSGVATFSTIYPGWYTGRITHIHFQIFLSNYGSTASSTAISQMAFPPAVTQAVYNSSLYTKGQNTSVTSFAADNVFSDGVTYELASITGDATNGYVATLEVGIAV